MDRENLIKAIEGDYTVIFLDGGISIGKDSAKEYFDRKKYYNVGKSIKIPNHKDDFLIVGMSISEKKRTLFVEVREDCKCSDYYNCCDCGGNECGCSYCFSCNACEECLSE